MDPQTSHQDYKGTNGQEQHDGWVSCLIERDLLLKTRVSRPLFKWTPMTAFWLSFFGISINCMMARSGPTNQSNPVTQEGNNGSINKKSERKHSNNKSLYARTCTTKHKIWSWYLTFNSINNRNISTDSTAFCRNSLLWESHHPPYRWTKRVCPGHRRERENTWRPWGRCTSMRRVCCCLYMRKEMGCTSNSNRRSSESTKAPSNSPDT